jgi:Zn-dependent M32 family carboxypeptidase
MLDKNNSELRIDNSSGYKEALEKVIQLRLQRKEIYGDSWKEKSDWELLAQIKEKVGRLENRIINKNKEYENEIDTLIDLVNYSLFLLQNKLEEKEA